MRLRARKQPWDIENLFGTCWGLESHLKQSLLDARCSIINSFMLCNWNRSRHKRKKTVNFPIAFRRTMTHYYCSAFREIVLFLEPLIISTYLALFPYSAGEGSDRSGLFSDSLLEHNETDMEAWFRCSTSRWTTDHRSSRDAVSALHVRCHFPSTSLHWRRLRNNKFRV